MGRTVAAADLQPDDMIRDEPGYEGEVVDRVEAAPGGRVRVFLAGVSRPKVVPPSKTFVVTNRG